MAEWPNARTDLMREALLYAAGEHDAPGEFEKRLADDTAAQEALIDAVQLGSLLSGCAARPNSSYRAIVRDRCVANLLAPPKRRLGRVAEFAFAGALMLIIAPGASDRSEALPALAADGKSAMVNAPIGGSNSLARLPNGDEAPESEGDADMLETALEWAELSNCGDHLQRTLDDEARRRSRQRERQRIQFEPPNWDSALAQPAPPD